MSIHVLPFCVLLTLYERRNVNVFLAHASDTFAFILHILDIFSV